MHDTVFIPYRIGVLFTRHHFHSISDWGPVYKTPFSFHIRLGFCLPGNASLCTAMVSLSAFAYTAHSVQLPNEWEGRTIDNEVPYRVDTGFNRLLGIRLVSWKREADPI